ncbi:MAG: nitroreductase family protein [Deltaproteobacteria bacterium]|nr:nitroreductase family protein [Deltaproteobacteria bacterium]
MQLILEATNNAPSAGNLQAFKIFLLYSQDVKNEIATAAFNQDFIREAPLVMVFFADKDASAKYGTRGRDLYSLQDATIAAIFAWLSAVDLGLAGVWVGAFDDGRISGILGAGDSLQPVAILPIGYAGESPGQAERKILKEIATVIK